MLESDAKAFIWETEFQSRVLTLMIQDSSFLGTFAGHMQPAYWRLKTHQLLAESLLEFSQKYRLAPSPAGLWEMARSKLGTVGNEAVTEHELREAFDHVRMAEVLDRGYVLDAVQAFCQRSAMAEAIKQGPGLLLAGQTDRLRKMVVDASEIAVVRNQTIDYLADTLQRLVKRQTGTEQVRIPTGMGWLDELICGGLVRQKVGVIMAPTRTGKSSLLVAIAASMVMIGLRVLHFTHELLDWETSLRYDCSITGLTSSEIGNHPEVVVSCLEHARLAGGGMRVHYAPRQTMGVREYKAVLGRCRGEGFDPHVVVSDYGDLIKPSQEYREKRDSVAQRFEDLTQFAQEEDLGLWTATQTNRGGYHQARNDLDDVAESFNKMQVVYLCLGLSSDEDMEREHKARVKVLKHTGAPDGAERVVYFDRGAQRFS